MPSRSWSRPTAGAASSVAAMEGAPALSLTPPTPAHAPGAGFTPASSGPNGDHPATARSAGSLADLASADSDSLVVGADQRPGLVAVRASPGCAAHCGEAWSADRAQSQGRSQPPQSTAERAGSQRPGSATAGRADRGTGSISSLARPELPAAAAGGVWRLPAAVADHRAGRGVEPQLGGDLPAAFAPAGTTPVIAGRAQRPEIGNERVRGLPVPPARPTGVQLARPAVLAPGLTFDPGATRACCPHTPQGSWRAGSAL